MVIFGIGINRTWQHYTLWSCTFLRSRISRQNSHNVSDTPKTSCGKVVTATLSWTEKPANICQ